MKRMWSEEELDKMIEQGGGGGDVTASDIDSEDATAGQVLQADGNGGSVWADINDVVADDIDSESATQGQVLTADGNGGASWQDASGGGDKLYGHNIQLSSLAGEIHLYVINKSNTAFTISTLQDYFASYNVNNMRYPATGYTTIDTVLYSVVSVFKYGTNGIYFDGINLTNQQFESTKPASPITISDRIVEL